MRSPPTGYRLQSEDTSYETELLLIERWRSMTPDEKAALTAQASRDLRNLTLAGLRQRIPEASERELGIRFAALAYGRDLVRRVMGIEVPPEDVRIS
jgi:hypothetical protein